MAAAIMKQSCGQLAATQFSVDHSKPMFSGEPSTAGGWSLFVIGVMFIIAGWTVAGKGEKP